MSIKKAKRLLNDAIGKNILSGRKNSFVMVYRRQCNNLPEGWYKDSIDQVAMELSKDRYGYEQLNKAVMEAD